MQRRSFVFGLIASGLAAAPIAAKTRTDLRTHDLMTGEFALMSSQLALTKDVSFGVAEFANAEIAEQLQVSQMLEAAPGSAPLRPDHARLFSRLNETSSGRAFERDYVMGQISGQRELLALNEAYVRTGTNAQYRSVAEMSLPIIGHHLATSMSLREIA